MKLFVSNLLKIFVPDFSPFFYVSLTYLYPKSGHSGDSVLVSNFTIFWNKKVKKERRYHYGFSHYASWSMNFRIYYFYCCGLASARENESPYPSLCHSLHRYVPVLFTCFLQIFWTCPWLVFVSFLWNVWITNYGLIFRSYEQFVFSLWYAFNNFLYVSFSIWITTLLTPLISYDWILYDVDIYDDLISRRVNSSDAEKFAEVCPCPCNGFGWGVIWWVFPYGNILQYRKVLLGQQLPVL